MAIKTRKECESPKEKTKQGTEKTPSSAPILEVVTKDRPKVFILQDPESRTYKDSITLEGKKIDRVVERGRIKTDEEVLKTFLVAKGWILLDTI